MKGLIEFITQALVDHPENVCVTEKKLDDGSLVIELRVATEDMGRVIGRKGMTIKAMRQLLAASSTKTRTKVSLIIQE